MKANNHTDNRKKNRLKKAKRNRRIALFKRFTFLALLALVIVFTVKVLHNKGIIRNFDLNKLSDAKVPDYVDVQIIDIDGSSRRDVKLDGFNDIVIHYVGNPGSSAQGNHDYYTNPDSGVSSHFVVGLDGEIIQCIPLDEKSSASNDRNHDTISIEVCHPDESGRFNSATYASVIKLTAWLLDLGDLKESHIIRHYDVTGKICPKYYVEHPDAWELLKQDVKNCR